MIVTEVKQNLFHFALLLFLKINNRNVFFKIIELCALGSMNTFVRIKYLSNFV